MNDTAATDGATYELPEPIPLDQVPRGRMMKRGARALIKIMPRQYKTLRECVIASFEANGPMTDEELCRSLPHFMRESIKRAVAALPDELTGR